MQDVHVLMEMATHFSETLCFRGHLIHHGVMGLVAENANEYGRAGNSSYLL